MRIAVTYEDDIIFQHFGKSKQFKVYDIDEGKIVNTSLIKIDDNQEEPLANIFKKGNVDTVICGGIGQGAITKLSEVGISIYRGISGSSDEAVLKLLNGELLSIEKDNCKCHK